MSDTGGAKANRTGQSLEEFVSDTLKKHGYQKINDKKVFRQAHRGADPIFASQYPLGKTIYGTEHKCDFILYHPDKFPDNLVIEVKWQQTSGTVDEKYPYLVENLRKYGNASIIILDGGGYKPGAEKWLRDQTDDKDILHVFNMSEFQTWANNRNI